MPPPPGSFRILLFHDIAHSQEPVFAALIGHIARTDGFITPVEAAERMAGAASIQDGRVPCLVSFDDGFASNRVIAETVLARHGVKALFFVCPGLVDLAPVDRPAAVARGIFDGRVTAAAAPAQRPLMEWDDLRALASANHEIGAHSMTHRRLTGLAREALHQEIGGACERLTQKLDRPAVWFAWPFGDIDSIDAASLSVIGQHARLCRSGVRGLNRPRQHRLVIFADHVDLAASAAWQRLVIAGGLDRRYRAARAHLAGLAGTGDQ